MIGDDDLIFLILQLDDVALLAGGILLRLGGNGRGDRREQYRERKNAFHRHGATPVR